MGATDKSFSPSCSVSVRILPTPGSPTHWDSGIPSRPPIELGTPCRHHLDALLRLLLFGPFHQPPCRDNVQYYVLDSPANKIDKDQMSAIHRLLCCHPDEDLRFNPYMWGNYRHTTPYQQGHVRYVEWH